MTPPSVIVTGASRGIGLAITTILLKTLNARVVTVSRSITAELKALKAQHPNDLADVQGDVTEPDVNQKAINTALDKFGRLDGLVLNAGILEMGLVATPELDLAKWKKSFDVNFFSLITSLHYSIPTLRKFNGNVVMVSSGAATSTRPGWGPYSATKAAMNSLVRQLAVEELDFRSIAIRPGFVDTAMVAQLRGPQGEAVMPKDVHQQMVDREAVTPEFPGHVIAKLALGIPKEFSGGYLSWDSEELKAFQP